MFDQLAALLTQLSKQRYEESFVDRLYSQITTWKLIVFAVTITAKQYVGKPLQCWCPASFTKAWEQYVEHYCFVENTYYLPMKWELLNEHGDVAMRQLNYYQWVPFVLALMAILFLIPRYFWRACNRLSALSVRSVVGMACDTVNVGKAKDLDESTNVIAQHVQQYATERQLLKATEPPLQQFIQYGRTKSTFLVFAYLLTKLFYVLTIVLQFFTLKNMLGYTNMFWGLSVLRGMILGDTWYDTGNFPRVTLCDLNVRVFGNLQQYSVQCVLMVNMFNEKIFLYIYWWLLFLGLVSVLDLFYWTFDSLLPFRRSAFVKQLLAAHYLPRAEHHSCLSTFLGEMPADTVLVLRLMSGNAGELITSQVVCKMWLQYLEDSAEPDLGKMHLRNTLLKSRCQK